MKKTRFLFLLGLGASALMSFGIASSNPRSMPIVDQYEMYQCGRDLFVLPTTHPNNTCANKEGREVVSERGADGNLVLNKSKFREALNQFKLGAGQTPVVDKLIMKDIKLPADSTQLFTAISVPIELENINTSEVTSMQEMFFAAQKFNQALNFDTAKVTNMSGMFAYASSFNSPLTFSDTSKVTTMAGMFAAAQKFNQALNFDTSSVTTMREMFAQAWDFNQALNFDTAKVEDMSGMFSNASKFNSPLTFSDTSKVKDISKMFYYASAFDQALDHLSYASVEKADGFLANKYIPVIPKEVIDGIKNQFKQDLPTQLTKQFGAGAQLMLAQSAPVIDGIAARMQTDEADLPTEFALLQGTPVADRLLGQKAQLLDRKNGTPYGKANYASLLKKMNADLKTTPTLHVQSYYCEAEKDHDALTKRGVKILGDLKLCVHSKEEFKSPASNLQDGAVITGDVIEFKVADADGNLMPADANALTYTIEGDGKELFEIENGAIKIKKVADLPTKDTTYTLTITAKANPNAYAEDKKPTETGIFTFHWDVTAPNLALNKTVLSEYRDTPVEIAITTDVDAVVSLSGKNIPTWLKLEQKDGKWILTGTTDTNYTTYTFDVVAKDKAGNEVIKQVSVTVKKRPSAGGGGSGGGSIVISTTPVTTGSVNTGSVNTGNLNTGIVEKLPELQKTEDGKLKYADNLVFNPTIENGKCYTRRPYLGIKDSVTIITSEEFKKAQSFFRTYEMTMFDSVDGFDPYRNLSREEAAKIFSQFAINVLCRKPDLNLHTNYSDVENADPTLKPYIELAYQLGVMKGSGMGDGEFRPFDYISKAEVNAVLIRMILKSYLDENQSIWYSKYNEVATTLGIITQGAGAGTVSRNDVALMLFRAYKNQVFDWREVDYFSYVLDSRDLFLR